MKAKWDTRVYIDLFAGPGIVRVKGSRRLLWGSPLLALQVSDQFDKYILCESDPRLLDALKQRCSILAPKADIAFVEGDCNDKVDAICSKIPAASKNNRVLSFCFVDPYDLSVKFSTIKRIAAVFVDFLVLLALHMDAGRNEAHYTNPTNHKLDDFLGQSEWRKRWQSRSPNTSFSQFLAEEYAHGMQELGYLRQPFQKMKEIRSDLKNLPLYRLALFSRHPLAYQYWEEVLRYSTSQTDFDFGQ